MTTPATISRAVASPAVAPGTTAPVLEFLCLFTHDLKRKQKRWQDGRVKYHTFNRRVMTYDDRGNYIGDTHWRSDWDLDVGEEIQLERGGVIVQISDCVGRELQDLSELVDKRIQDREQRVREQEQRRTSSLASSRPPLLSLPAVTRPDAPHVRHRPLTALVGTPTGHHGRALVPSDSPFEQRKRAEETPTREDASRSIKRRRYDDTPPSKLGYAQSLFGTTLTLSGAPPSSARLPSQPAATHARPITARQPSPRPAGPASPAREAAIAPTLTPPQQSDHVPVRAPLHTMDERRTNSVAKTAKQRITRERPSRRRVSRQAEAMQGTPSAEPRSRSKSPPKEMTDLTLTDDDTEAGAPAARGKPPPLPLQQSGPSGASASPPDTGMRRKSHSARARISTRMPDGGMDVDEPPPVLNDQAEAPTKMARRTELRLTSRRKRGLLVATEQATNKPTEDVVERPPPSETVVSLSPDHGADTERRDVDGSPQRKEYDAQAYDPADASDTAQETQGEEAEDLGSKAQVPVKKSRRKTKHSETGLVGAGLDGGGEVEPLARSGARQRLRRESARHRNPAPTEQGDGDLDPGATIGTITPPQAEPPRFVKLSRKSVRSKELIGYSFSDREAGLGNGSFSVSVSDGNQTEEFGPCPAPPVPDQADVPGPEPCIAEDMEARSLSERSSRPDAEPEGAQAQPCMTAVTGAMDADTTTHGEPRPEEAARTFTGGESTTAPQAPRKLINPATRGRKAALKSHAAGQVPQPVLPADVGLLPPQIALRAHEHAKATGAGPTSAASEPPKIKMTFPGFASVKAGGPWSREAHDLLESGRPC